MKKLLNAFLRWFNGTPGEPPSPVCLPCATAKRVMQARVLQRAHIPWPNPTPEMLEDPAFEAIWQTVKRWDVNVPEAYHGYMGCTGNHARAIYDAIAPFLNNAKAEKEAA